MSTGHVSPIELQWGACQPTALELGYLGSVIELAGAMVPDLSQHVSHVLIRPSRLIPPKAAMVMDEDELFMLQFINAAGKFMWPADVTSKGWIEIDYTPFPDFMVALFCHEMAHALERDADPTRLIAARSTKTRMQKHGQSWSNIAVKLYQICGCTKAGLFHDGMGYPSTRKRHTKMVPSEREWLNRVWASFDNHEFGTLRSEFTDLFTIGGNP